MASVFPLAFCVYFPLVTGLPILRIQWEIKLGDQQSNFRIIFKIRGFNSFMASWFLVFCLITEWWNISSLQYFCPNPPNCVYCDFHPDILPLRMIGEHLTGSLGTCVFHPYELNLHLIKESCTRLLFLLQKRSYKVATIQRGPKKVYNVI